VGAGGARAARRGGDGDERVASMLACVRASGLKLTPQRMAIVRELAADPTHPTAQELFERLRGTLPTMSFATVYNTLDALAAAGLCVALALSPGAARFDPNMAAHDHAACDRCGLVRDVPCEPPEAGRAAAEIAPSPGLSAVQGFEVRAVERIYRGLCAACADEVAGAPGARGRVGARPRGALATPARSGRRVARA
jgi:Fur family peroxide stress response transcriptional regulator